MANPTVFSFYFAKIHWLLILLYFGSVNSICQGQNLQTTIEFADNELFNGRYENAVKEYQRAFLFSNDTLKPILARQIGKCYFELKNFEQSEAFYSLGCDGIRNDSIKLECSFEKMSAQIWQNKYYSVIEELGKLSDTLSTHFTTRKFFYWGICYWGINEFKMAFMSFLESIPEKDILKRQQLQRLQDLFFKQKHPNYKLAIALSIIPGLGQLYSGNLESGLNSFILCGCLFITGFASVYLLQSGVILLNLIPWIQRYYIGGMKRARIEALQVIEDRKNKTFNDILQLLANKI